MEKLILYFSECEHNGDLQNYAGDVRNSGATILELRCDTEQETGIIKVEVQDVEAFKTKFKETDSHGFLMQY
jgi:hypothetical protein